MSSQNQCPKGQRFEPSLGKCIPILEDPYYKPCAKGFEKDPVTGECVPRKPPVPNPQPNPNPNPDPAVVKIAMVGDSKSGAEAEKTFSNIKKEGVNHFVFLGDMSYNDDEAKSWTSLVDKVGLKNVIAVVKGNHEDDEEDADAAGKDIEAWLPGLAEGKGGGPWTSAYQVHNCYFINMNSQDLDYQYAGRTQHKWVKSELEKAVALRNDGKIDWIFVSVHKPNYTMKTKHPAELKARDIYQPLFDQAQVDFVSAGHNHDCQIWKPMAYNDKNLFSVTADGKAYDFSKAHGQIIMINGLAGRGQTPIKEDPKSNKNILFASWKFYGYTMFYVKGRQLTMQVKSNDGKVQYQLTVDKTGGNIVVTPPTTPTPQPQPQPTPQPQPQPQPKPDTGGGQTGGELDQQLGIKWMVAKGKITTIEQTRDEADDDRWSGNVTGLRNGFEATMIAKGTGVASDGHFAMKQFSGNHSGSGTEKNAWYDTGVRSNGEVQLQYEQPHPSNNDFNLPDSQLFIKNIGKPLEGNWIGLKWSCITLKPNGSPEDGGVRCRMWVDTNPIGSDGKPTNNWKLVYDFVDTGQVIKGHTPPDEQDCEVRRSGTKSHEVYGNGLHVRAL